MFPTSNCGKGAQMGEADSEWWRDFFDDDYVTAWTAAGMFDATDEEVAALIDRLALPQGARILDAACGFGRIAGPLHEHGYAVTGIDINASQLACAERDHPGPGYVAADMRDPPAGPYEAVLNLFSSFGYFGDDAEDLRALRAWREALVPGGHLVMTLTHRDRVVAWEVTGAVDDDERVLREEAVTDWARGLRYITWHFGDIQKQAILRLYTATELVAMCHQAGFEQVTATGGIDGHPLSPETVLCVHARTPGNGWSDSTS